MILHALIAVALAGPFDTYTSYGDVRFNAPSIPQLMASTPRGLLTVSSDGRVIAWNQDGQIRWTSRMDRPNPPILALSPDGELVALADRDSVFLQSVADGSEIAVIPASSRYKKRLRRASSARFTKDGRRLIIEIGPAGTAIRSWDIAGGSRDHRPNRVPNVAQTFGVDGETWVHVQRRPDAVKVLVDRGGKLQALPACEARPVAYAMSGDGRTFVGIGHEICVWNLENATTIAQLPSGGQIIGARATSYPAFDRTRAAMSHDGTTLAVVTDQTRCAVFDVATGETRWEATSPEPHRRSPQFTNQGDLLVYNSNRAVQVHDVENGAITQEFSDVYSPDELLRGPEGFVRANGYQLPDAPSGPVGVRSLSFIDGVLHRRDLTGDYTVLSDGVLRPVDRIDLPSPPAALQGTWPTKDGNVVEIDEERIGLTRDRNPTGVHVINPSRPRFRYEGEFLPVYSLRLAPDETAVYAGTEHSGLMSWPMRASAKPDHDYVGLHEPGRPHLSEDGRLLAAGAFFSPDVAVWPTDSEAFKVEPILEHSMKVKGEHQHFSFTSLALSPDGSRIAAALAGGELVVVGVPTGEILLETDFTESVDWVRSMVWREDELWVGTIRGEIRCYGCRQ